MFDTHAHLNARQFDRDRDEVIRRAFDAGVEGIIEVGTDLASSRESVALAERYDQVFAAVGCHPHDVGRMEGEVWEHLEALAAHEKVVAIGETGLDFYRDLSPRATQVEGFRAHVGLAKRTGLPLIVHNRGADREVMAVLRAERADRTGGVLHCFGGGADMAREAAAINFHLGIGGAITLGGRRSESAAGEVPLERMLLETDCPYLAPVPHRGKRNEPALLSHVLDRVAEVRPEGRAEIEGATTGNAYRLFGLAQRATRP
jgi:TatD DNase family protein